MSAYVREAKFISNRDDGVVLPGYGLFLEVCVGGSWRTYWLRLDGGGK